MRLTRNEGLELLKIARRAIDNHLNAATDVPEQSEAAALNRETGCFVTIEMDGQLRGCIGTFTSQLPLQQEVRQMAVAAATGDPRFYAMTCDDIGCYTLDISILSPLEKISDTNLIEVGTHGIYLENNYSRGVLLPQVATEYGWDRQTFIEQTCVKAGLPTDAWQSPQTDIYTFTAQIVSDHNRD